MYNPCRTSFAAADDSFYTFTDRWNKLNVAGGGGLRGRWGHSMVLRASTVLIYGGYSPAGSGTYLSDLVKWDLDEIAKGAVLTVMEPDGPQPARAYHAAAVLDSSMYLFGGYDGTDLHNSLWRVTVSGAKARWSLVVSNDDGAPRLVHAALVVRPSGMRTIATVYGGAGADVGVKTVPGGYDPLGNPGALAPSAAILNTVISKGKVVIIIVTLTVSFVLIGFVVAFCVYRFVTREKRWTAELETALQDGSLAVEAENEDAPDGKVRRRRDFVYIYIYITAISPGGSNTHTHLQAILCLTRTCNLTVVFPRIGSKLLHLHTHPHTHTHTQREMATAMLAALERRDPTEHRRQLRMRAVHDAVARGEDPRAAAAEAGAEEPPGLVPADRI
jgi:hypothetical protein